MRAIFGIAGFGIGLVTVSSAHAQVILVPVAPQYLAPAPIMLSAPGWQPVQSQPTQSSAESRYQTPEQTRETPQLGSNQSSGAESQPQLIPAPMVMVPGMPMLVPAAPIATPQPPARIERYYFDPSFMNGSRRSQLISASNETAVPGQTIVREYYYISPKKAESPKEAQTEEPANSKGNDPEKLTMPSPDEALQLKEAPRPEGELSKNADAKSLEERLENGIPIDPSAPAPAPPKEVHDDRAPASPRGPRDLPEE